ncbi:MAG: hypothetical protein AB8C84_11080 [Oligoflexales bacterium]
MKFSTIFFILILQSNSIFAVTKEEANLQILQATEACMTVECCVESLKKCIEDIRVSSLINSLDDTHYAIFWKTNIQSSMSIVAPGHTYLFTRRKHIDLRVNENGIKLFNRQRAIDSLSRGNIEDLKYLIINETSEKIRDIETRIESISNGKDDLLYRGMFHSAPETIGFVSGEAIMNFGCIVGASSILISGAGLALLGLTGPLAAAGALGTCILSTTGIITGGQYISEKCLQKSEAIADQHTFHCGSIIAHCLELAPSDGLQQVSGFNQSPAEIIKKLAHTKKIESSQGFDDIKYHTSTTLDAARKNILKPKPIERYQYKPFKKWHPLEISQEKYQESNKQRKLFQEARMFSRFFESQIEWRRIHPQTYDLAEEKGWLSIMCAHMDHTIRDESIDSCTYHAQEFLSLEEWKQSCKKSYSAASNQGWIHLISERVYPAPKEKLSFSPYAITTIGIATIAIIGYLNQAYLEGYDS